MFRVGGFIHGGKVTARDVEVLEEKLLFDRTPIRDRYVKFFVLLFLAGVIATYGVVSDSIATIIGAMIVAPLMTPIMAVSLSALSGDGKNIMISTGLVAAGTAFTVFLAWGLAAILPGMVQIAGNGSITSRTSPRLIDLIVALAAGAAGAFATSREDVSDALPGVAIAVSLVPPLSVVGVCLAGGAGHDAMGAFILFLTNFLAIVAAGLIVFAIMGFGGASLSRKNRKTKKWANITVVAAILLICVPLGVTSYRTALSRVLVQKTQSAAEQWLKGTDYDVINVEADVRDVNMVIAGDGELPGLDVLLTDLGKKTSQKINLSVRVVPERTLKGTTGSK
ncbi:MAG: DUF389 domain-containing protein [Actinobacteria bacterium]|nr:DUF389 domain-containing protein [Actinomycetota bacterium]